jgi:hypothetical protein
MTKREGRGNDEGKNATPAPPLPPPGLFDGGDVDLFHLQHRGKRPLGLRPAVADDGVPVAVGLGLVFGGNLKREGLVVGERRPAVEAEAGDDA